MTAAENNAYFNLLVDKVESGYFTNDEIDTFITQATIEYIHRMLPPGQDHFELDEINYNKVYTLVYTTAGLNMSAGGVITTAAVQAALNTASSSTEGFMGILGVSWTKSGASYPIKYTRNNNWFSYLNNSFKQGSSTSPRYRYDKTNFTFYPIDTGASVTFTLLKQPKPFSVNTSTTIELPDSCHKEVVELAVDIASVALREQDLRALNTKQ